MPWHIILYMYMYVFNTMLDTTFTLYESSISTCAYIYTRTYMHIGTGNLTLIVYMFKYRDTILLKVHMCIYGTSTIKTIVKCVRVGVIPMLHVRAKGLY